MEELFVVVFVDGEAEPGASDGGGEFEDGDKVANIGAHCFEPFSRVVDSVGAAAFGEGVPAAGLLAAELEFDAVSDEVASPGLLVDGFEEEDVGAAGVDVGLFAAETVGKFPLGEFAQIFQLIKQLSLIRSHFVLVIQYGNLIVENILVARNNRFFELFELGEHFVLGVPVDAIEQFGDLHVFEGFHAGQNFDGWVSEDGFFEVGVVEEVGAKLFGFVARAGDFAFHGFDEAGEAIYGEF